jgi:hypothetical protein
LGTGKGLKPLVLLDCLGVAENQGMSCHPEQNIVERSRSESSGLSISAEMLHFAALHTLREAISSMTTRIHTAFSNAGLSHKCFRIALEVKLESVSRLIVDI